jgi:hypothetical protein
MFPGLEPIHATAKLKFSQVSLSEKNIFCIYLSFSSKGGLREIGWKGQTEGRLPTLYMDIKFIQKEIQQC